MFCLGPQGEDGVDNAETVRVTQVLQTNSVHRVREGETVSCHKRGRAWPLQRRGQLNVWSQGKYTKGGVEATHGWLPTDPWAHLPCPDLLDPGSVSQ